MRKEFVARSLFGEQSVQLQLPPLVAECLFLCIDLTREALETVGAAPLAPEEEARLLPSERLARALVSRGERVPEWDAVLALCELFTSVLVRKEPEAAGAGAQG